MSLIAINILGNVVKEDKHLLPSNSREKHFPTYQEQEEKIQLNHDLSFTMYVDVYVVDIIKKLEVQKRRAESGKYDSSKIFTQSFSVI